MREYYPLLLTGAIIGVLSIVFIVAFLSIKDKKTAIGFDRKMKDKEPERYQQMQEFLHSFMLPAIQNVVTKKSIYS